MTEGTPLSEVLFSLLIGLALVCLVAVLIVREGE